MSTVIDQLVVELGLDASKFTLQQRESFEAAKRLEQQQLKAAKNVEYSAGRTSDSIQALGRKAIGAFALITASKGLADFAVSAVQAGAAVGRVSRSINVSSNIITRWQGLAKIFGGSPESMAESFVRMSDTLKGWERGQIDPIVAQYRALAAEGGTVIDINRGVNRTMLDIQKNLQAIHSRDPAGAGYWARRLGIDPGMFDAMISKSGEFNRMLKEMTSLTDAQTDAAGRLERKWNEFTERAKQGTRGAFLDTAAALLDWMEGNTGGQARSRGGGKTSGSAAATVSGSGGSGGFKSQAEKEAYIRAAAARRGINPNVAMAVARSEGFNSFQSTVPVRGGPNGREDSWGAFQLYMGGGLGNEFQKATGLDPRNPANERATIDFALDNARKGGWGPFHGAKNTGISQWQGIDRNVAGKGGNTSTTEVNIGTVVVNAKTDDPNGMANAFSDAVKHRAFASQANVGQN